jgi:sRNA-binding regulator protein Hfq
MPTPSSDNKAPSIAELQKFVREKMKLEFHLVNGERTTGTLRWFDEHCFSVTMDDQSVITIVRGAVLSYRAV